MGGSNYPLNMGMGNTGGYGYNQMGSGINYGQGGGVQMYPNSSQNLGYGNMNYGNVQMGSGMGNNNMNMNLNNTSNTNTNNTNNNSINQQAKATPFDF